MECRNEFDELFWMTEDKRPLCPSCFSKDTVQLVGKTANWFPASAVMTGKGWDGINKQAATNLRNEDM